MTKLGKLVVRIIKANQEATEADAVPFWTVAECVSGFASQVKVMETLNALVAAGMLWQGGGQAVMQRTYSVVVN